MARRYLPVMRLPGAGSTRAMEKWGQPLRVIFLDYVEVGKDVARGTLQRPIRSILYGLIGGLVITAWRKNPDYASFENDVLEYSNELSLCSKPLRNPRAQAYIERLIGLKSDGYLRHISFGVFSIMILRSVSPSCKNYHEVCPYLQPRLWTVYERVVDVGVWGKWLLLERHMVDFDVNQEALEKSLANQG